MAILLRAADFVFVLRPMIMIPAWSLYVLGVHAPAPGRAASTALVHPGFWCMTAVLASAYVINQIFDVESDRLNGKGLHLTRGLFRPRTMVLIAFAAFAAASLLYPRAAPVQTGPLISTLLLSFTYSLPPLRLCARPWLDLAANALGYGGVAFVLGASAVSRETLDAWLAAMPWMFLVGATFLHTTALDVAGDAASGKRTTSVAIGVTGSSRLAALLAAGALASAIFLFLRGKPLSLVVVMTAALVVFVAAAVFIERAERREAAVRMLERTTASSFAVQATTAMVAVAAAWKDPWLLALLVPIVVGARYYYRERFELRYPF
jgi:4-hydroxybenzoate polyprenyltransferase